MSDRRYRSDHRDRQTNDPLSDYRIPRKQNRDQGPPARNQKGPPQQGMQPAPLYDRFHTQPNQSHSRERPQSGMMQAPAHHGSHDSLDHNQWPQPSAQSGRDPYPQSTSGRPQNGYGGSSSYPNVSSSSHHSQYSGQEQAGSSTSGGYQQRNFDPRSDAQPPYKLRTGHPSSSKKPPFKSGFNDPQRRNNSRDRAQDDYDQRHTMNHHSGRASNGQVHGMPLDGPSSSYSYYAQSTFDHQKPYLEGHLPQDQVGGMPPVPPPYQNFPGRLNEVKPHLSNNLFEDGPEAPNDHSPCSSLSRPERPTHWVAARDGIEGNGTHYINYPMKYNDDPVAAMFPPPPPPAQPPMGRAPNYSSKQEPVEDDDDVQIVGKNWAMRAKRRVVDAQDPPREALEEHQEALLDHQLQVMQLESLEDNPSLPGSDGSEDGADENNHGTGDAETREHQRGQKELHGAIRGSIVSMDPRREHQAARENHVEDQEVQEEPREPVDAGEDQRRGAQDGGEQQQQRQQGGPPRRAEDANRAANRGREDSGEDEDQEERDDDGDDRDDRGNFKCTLDDDEEFKDPRKDLCGVCHPDMQEFFPKSVESAKKKWNGKIQQIAGIALVYCGSCYQGFHRKCSNRQHYQCSSPCEDCIARINIENAAKDAAALSMPSASLGFARDTDEVAAPNAPVALPAPVPTQPPGRVLAREVLPAQAAQPSKDGSAPVPTRPLRSVSVSVIAAQSSKEQGTSSTSSPSVAIPPTRGPEVARAQAIQPKDQHDSRMNAAPALTKPPRHASAPSRPVQLARPPQDESARVPTGPSLNLIAQRAAKRAAGQPSKSHEVVDVSSSDDESAMARSVRNVRREERAEPPGEGMRPAAIAEEPHEDEQRGDEILENRLEEREDQEEDAEAGELEGENGAIDAQEQAPPVPRLEVNAIQEPVLPDPINWNAVSLLILNLKDCRDKNTGLFLHASYVIKTIDNWILHNNSELPLINSRSPSDILEELKKKFDEFQIRLNAADGDHEERAGGPLPIQDQGAFFDEYMDHPEPTHSPSRRQGRPICDREDESGAEEQEHQQYQVPPDDAEEGENGDDNEEPERPQVLPEDAEADELEGENGAIDAQEQAPPVPRLERADEPAEEDEEDEVENADEAAVDHVVPEAGDAVEADAVEVINPQERIRQLEAELKRMRDLEEGRAVEATQQQRLLREQNGNLQTDLEEMRQIEVEKGVADTVEGLVRLATAADENRLLLEANRILQLEMEDAAAQAAKNQEDAHKETDALGAEVTSLREQTRQLEMKLEQIEMEKKKEKKEKDETTQPKGDDVHAMIPEVPLADCDKDPASIADGADMPQLERQDEVDDVSKADDDTTAPPKTIDDDEEKTIDHPTAAINADPTILKEKEAKPDAAIHDLPSSSKTPSDSDAQISTTIITASKVAGSAALAEEALEASASFATTATSATVATVKDSMEVAARIPEDPEANDAMDESNDLESKMEASEKGADLKNMGEEKKITPSEPSEEVTVGTTPSVGEEGGNEKKGQPSEDIASTPRTRGDKKRKKEVTTTITPSEETTMDTTPEGPKDKNQKTEKNMKDDVDQPSDEVTMGTTPEVQKDKNQKTEKNTKDDVDKPSDEVTMGTTPNVRVKEGQKKAEEKKEDKKMDRPPEEPSTPVVPVKESQEPVKRKRGRPSKERVEKTDVPDLVPPSDQKSGSLQSPVEPSAASSSKRESRSRGRKDDDQKDTVDLNSAPEPKEEKDQETSEVQRTSRSRGPKKQKEDDKMEPDQKDTVKMGSSAQEEQDQVRGRSRAKRAQKTEEQRPVLPTERQLLMQSKKEEKEKKNKTTVEMGDSRRKEEAEEKIEKNSGTSSKRPEATEESNSAASMETRSRSPKKNKNVSIVAPTQSSPTPAEQPSKEEAESTKTDAPVTRRSNRRSSAHARVLPDEAAESSKDDNKDGSAEEVTTPSTGRNVSAPPRPAEPEDQDATAKNKKVRDQDDDAYLDRRTLERRKEEEKEARGLHPIMVDINELKKLAESPHVAFELPKKDYPKAATSDPAATPVQGSSNQAAATVSGTVTSTRGRGRPSARRDSNVLASSGIKRPYSVPATTPTQGSSDRDSSRRGRRSKAPTSDAANDQSQGDNGSSSMQSPAMAAGAVPPASVTPANRGRAKAAPAPSDAQIPQSSTSRGKKRSASNGTSMKEELAKEAAELSEATEVSSSKRRVAAVPTPTAAVTPQSSSNAGKKRSASSGTQKNQQMAKNSKEAELPAEASSSKRRAPEVLPPTDVSIPPSSSNGGRKLTASASATSPTMPEGQNNGPDAVIEEHKHYVITNFYQLNVLTAPVKVNSILRSGGPINRDKKTKKESGAGKRHRSESPATSRAKKPKVAAKAEDTEKDDDARASTSASGAKRGRPSATSTGTSTSKTEDTEKDDDARASTSASGAKRGRPSTSTSRSGAPTSKTTPRTGRNASANASSRARGAPASASAPASRPKAAAACSAKKGSLKKH